MYSWLVGCRLVTWHQNRRFDRPLHWFQVVLDQNKPPPASEPITRQGQQGRTRLGPPETRQRSVCRCREAFASCRMCSCVAGSFRLRMKSQVMLLDIPIMVFNIRAYIGGVTLDKQYPMMHFTGIQYVAAGLKGESELFCNNDLYNTAI